MPRLTISYRRADSDAMAGRIRDKLADYYGQEAIFMDIDSIPVGIDFREQIKSELAKNDLLIVVVGPKWRGPGKAGRARINDENDPVRVEVETALQRGIPVVPVLVNGATIPKPDDLPDTLRNFSFHNGAIVDAGQDFHQHMERLIRSLDKVLGEQSRFPGDIPPPKPSNLRPVIKWAAALGGICAAVGAGAAGNWFMQTHGTPVTVLAPVPNAASGANSPEKVASNSPPAQSGTAGATSTTNTPGRPAASAPPNIAPPPSPPVTTAVQQPPASQSATSAKLASPGPQLAALPPTAKGVTAPPAGSNCNGNAAFEDDFHVPDAGWSRGLGVRTTGSNVFFGESHLVMKPAPKLSRTIVYPSLIFKSAAICATIQSPPEIKEASDTSAGVAFWAADDRNLYSLEVAPDGSYAVRRLIDNNWTFVTSKLKSEAVKQGPGEINQVEVRIKQNVAELFVNGVKLQDFKGQAPARISTVGFVVRNESDNDYEWKFHDIGVFEPK
jgi:hypothetical protein